MVPDTDRVYEREATRDPRVVGWNESVKPGVKCLVELYPDKVVEVTIWRFTVRRIRPGVYRAVVLYDLDVYQAGNVQAVETSREEAAQWLRRKGVPVLRIGPALPK